MRKFWIAAAAVALPIAAQAEGISASQGTMLGPLTAPAAAPNWTSAYIGLHGGYAWGGWDAAPSYDPGTGPIPGVFGKDQRDIDAEGWLAGGQVGFNVQSGSVVWGVEIDGAWSNAEESKAFVTPDKLYKWDITTRLDNLGTIRGRLGYLVTPSILLYGTAGLAFGQTSGDLTVTSKDGFDPPQVTAVGDASENHLGWTVGGGMEWVIGGKWSLKADYLYIDLGSVNYRLTGTAYPDKNPCVGPVSSSCSFPHTTDSLKGELDIHTIRFGLNYKLN